MIRLDEKTRAAFTASTEEDLESYLKAVKELLDCSGPKMQLFLKEQIAYAEREVARRAVIAKAKAKHAENYQLVAELKEQQLPLSPFVSEVIAMFLLRVGKISYGSLNLNANDKGGFSLSLWGSGLHAGGTVMSKSLDELCQKMLIRTHEKGGQLPTPDRESLAIGKELNYLLTLGHLSGFYTSFHLQQYELMVRFGNRRRKLDLYSFTGQLEAAAAGLAKLHELTDPDN